MQINAKEEAAIKAYQLGRLTHRQVGSSLGLDYWQTESFFQKHGVQLNYSVEDLEIDRANFLSMKD